MKGFGSQKIWSHVALETGDRITSHEVRASNPSAVTTFPDLVKEVAKLSVQNGELALFFRGQPRDYLLNNGASSSYPGIYRSPGKALSEAEIHKRFDILDDASKKVLARFRKERLIGHEKLGKFPELVWAILQHYEVCVTPLLDVTHSLRVAASFALNGSKEGLLLVYGFPHPTGSITFSVEQEFMNIRLLSICPPEATRPYFQEGFLVGTFPVRAERKHPSLDVCTRLIAKFSLLGTSFWSSDFHPIPDPALYPENDVVKSICDDIKCEHI